MRGLGRMLRSRPMHPPGGGYRHRGRRGGNTGVILLLIEILRVGWDHIPPITLSLVLGMVFIFINPVHWQMLPLGQACLSATKIIRSPGQQTYRILSHAFFHGDDIHLYYNMISLIHKGQQLEPRVGMHMYALMVASMTILEAGFYIMVVDGLRMIFGYGAPLVGSDCCVGFSGVLFGMKVILQQTDTNSDRVSTFFGLFSIPSRHAHWFELLLVSIIMPQSSFLGHLCGILAGLVVSHFYVGLISPRTHTYSYASDDSTNTSQRRRFSSDNSRMVNYDCPMTGCNHQFWTADELEFHINASHFNNRRNEYFSSSAREGSSHGENASSHEPAVERGIEHSTIPSNTNSTVHESRHLTQQELRERRIAKMQRQ
eukprot:CFRG0651T1